MSYYNPYNNGMYNYPYPSYTQPQPNMNMNNMYQQPTMQPQQQTFTPTFVSGIEGAKAYIVMPNQTMWLQDSEHDGVIYIKSADAQGKFSLNAFKMTPVSIEGVNNPTQAPQYATKNDLEAYLNAFNQRVDNLSIQLQKALEDQNKEKGSE